MLYLLDTDTLLSIEFPCCTCCTFHMQISTLFALSAGMEAHQRPPSKVARVMCDGKPSMSCGFTFMQLRELGQQSLIYSYIEAGIPVPTHLILPIWRSFPSSYIQRLFPNFLGYKSGYFDPKSGMDSEPSRCRRTDGKKWRCSRAVVEGQKYCRSHLNRGCLRSKGHVEPPTTTAAVKQSGNADKFSGANLVISPRASHNENE